MFHALVDVDAALRVLRDAGLHLLVRDRVLADHVRVALQHPRPRPVARAAGCRLTTEATDPRSTAPRVPWQVGGRQASLFGTVYPNLWNPVRPKGSKGRK